MIDSAPKKIAKDTTLINQYPASGRGEIRWLIDEAIV
jgi:hypothetical protein